jgi:hypothetical protein
MLICYVEQCVDRTYPGTMTIVAPFADSSDPAKCGYLAGLRSRTGVDVEGDAFHILVADKEGALTADGLVSTDSDEGRIKVDTAGAVELTKTLQQLFDRSVSGRLCLLLEYNGSATRMNGPPVPHEEISYAGLATRVEEGSLREDVLYMIVR